MWSSKNLITFGRPNACAIHTNVRKAFVVIFLRIISSSSSDIAHQIALVTIERNTAARLMSRSSTTATTATTSMEMAITWVALGRLIILPRMTSIIIILNIQLLPGASCSVKRKEWSMVTGVSTKTMMNWQCDCGRACCEARVPQSN